MFLRWRRKAAWSAVSMLMIHELGVDAPRAFREADARVDERLLARRARARRRRTIRTALMLLITAAILCIFVTWRRDKTAVAAQLWSLERPVVAIQAKIDAYNVIPPPSGELERGYYASDAERFYAMNTSEPVIIYFSPRIHLMLRQNGRAVIISEKGEEHIKVRAEWLTATEFLRAWLKQEKGRKAFEEKIRSRPVNLPP